jgi:glutamate-1-semialdehyde 2,1-aminomutase
MHPVAKSILDSYTRKTSISGLKNQRAQKVLPGGDTRAALFFKPYPLFMSHAEGCHISDCDGNSYIDFQNNYTSLLHGHNHPYICQKLTELLQKGPVLGSSNDLQVEMAETLTGRIPAMDTVRFCSSGTEATQYTIWAARAFTGRNSIVKIDGGFHGTHDFVMVNLDPDTNRPVLKCPGISPGVLEETLVIPYNNLSAAEKLLEEKNNQVAAIIVEPLIGSGGMIPAQINFLNGLRHLADKYQILLIFDEVLSFRLDLGGMQGKLNIAPDLTALGKFIGGGLGIGAFGGKKEIMDVFNPMNKDSIYHSGTFSGSSIALACGMANMELFDQAALEKINSLGVKLRNALLDISQSKGIFVQVTGMGSLLCLHWGQKPILDVKDVMEIRKSVGELPNLYHLAMLDQGIFASARGQYSISTVMSQKEIDAFMDSFEKVLDRLKPYIADVTPWLLEK